MSSVLRLVLRCNVLSLFNLSRMYAQALFTGIAVKSDTTSNEAITSSSEISILATSLANCEELKDRISIKVLDRRKNIRKELGCIIEGRANGRNIIGRRGKPGL